jgi:hypothetical protein
LLRWALIAYGVLCLIVAGILLALHATIVLVVYYNPQTGERDYHEQGSQE